MTDTSFQEHFEERHTPRPPRSPRSGRRSPSHHSDHGVHLRASLMKISECKRAKKIRFYRNGDRFFKGMVYAVSPERFRTFESLMAELTSSAICDKNSMPQGVRYMFSADGSKKISCIEELEDGESYVCASTDTFRKLDYNKTSNSPNWNQCRKFQGKDASSTSPGSSCGADSVWSSKRVSEEDIAKSFVRPKLITVIRNGSKPRKAVRVLLNRKTAHSFQQVLSDITEAIKLDSGTVRKVYTVDGRQVSTLADFFQDETVFIAYGIERLSADDFDLVESEVKHLHAYRGGGSATPRERVTLRSPKSSRRSSLPSVAVSKTSTGSTKALSPVLSPKSPRKLRLSSAPKYGFTNGIAPSPLKHAGEEYAENHDIPQELKDRYDIGQIIGEGNFALVRECEDKSSGRKYAMKIINKSKCKGKVEAVTQEVAILRQLKHPNIVQLVDDTETPTAVFVIMELVKGGDLLEAICSANKYTERDVSGMVYNLSAALSYLHSLNIVHRDVKPDNILVCNHGDGSDSLMLGDFGLAAQVPPAGLYTVCGTPTYVAPEVIAEVGYGLPIDVWSAGVITYILLCGYPPFTSPNDDQNQLFDKIIEGQFQYASPFWDNISDTAKDLIQGMLEVNPENRLSAREVLEHPWVAGDLAKTEDIHEKISKQLQTGTHLHIRKPVKPANIRLITTTALDKGSRYFQGRGQPLLTIHQVNHKQAGDGDEEVF